MQGVVEFRGSIKLGTYDPICTCGIRSGGLSRLSDAREIKKNVCVILILKLKRP